MTAAKINFDSHIAQCAEAITIHEFLEKHGYAADFGLRYVWVASVSALDHYVSELIVEKSTEHFSNGSPLNGRLLNEMIPISALLRIQTVSGPQAVVEFRSIVSQAIRFRTFQKANDIADGLAFVWKEQYKWEKISNLIGLNAKKTKSKLNGICYRRDLIAHNADFNEATGALTPCIREDAQEVSDYISTIVEAIDKLVP
ncbi:HEPN domain-containing protein [Nitratireductor sp. GCM10026969]|uniref:HEPN domain-containing protein n=1 Tax=Nitratireductor sp. GCM10026969 TaxID=3252645 RepID=UPI0036184757